MAEDNNDRIVKVTDLNAPIAQVWNALTDYKEFGQWFRVNLDQPFEIGAKSTGRMTYPGHEHVPWFAQIERMDPQRLFSFRWQDFDEPMTELDKTAPTLLVEFILEEIPTGTRLTIIESGFSALAEPRRIELMRGNVEGWTIQAGNLAQYLSE